MITIIDALQALRPKAAWSLVGDTYDGLEWLDTVQTKPTYDEVQDEITALVLQQPFDACKNEAKTRIAASDWSVLSDVGLANQADFVAYRATLRELIQNPVQNPQWPTEPQPVWSTK